MRRLIFLAALAAACSSKGSDPVTTVDTDAAVDDTATGPAPYELTVIDNARITSNDKDPNFQKATGDLAALKDGPFEKVTLHVELSSTCFPFDNWKTDKPPAGQVWPADCDAFDRNFETSLIDPATPDAPGLEMIRAITPFGGPLTIDEDVTDVFNAPDTKGARQIKVIIPTWSDGAGMVSGSNGGWNVTVKLQVTPGVAPHKVLAAKPLFYKSVDKTASTQTLPFEVPAGTTSGRVDYRVTGHGGSSSDTTCGQPADEFCLRQHHLSVDTKEIASPKPWRSDCKKLCTLTDNTSGVGPAKYCKENPCGATASVRAPRANWCPGSETPPIQLTDASLAASGKHDFKFAIDGIADGGSWSVSATYFAYGD
ncbi:MAG: peptide-N-glycosidase F-related protein [Polyangiales bacterium]